MNIGVFKCHEMLFEKHSKIVFYKNNGKSHRKIATIAGHSKSAAFGKCKKFFN